MKKADRGRSGPNASCSVRKLERLLTGLMNASVTDSRAKLNSFPKITHPCISACTCALQKTFLFLLFFPFPRFLFGITAKSFTATSFRLQPASVVSICSNCRNCVSSSKRWALELPGSCLAAYKIRLERR